MSDSKTFKPCRQSLPSPQFERNDISLWSVLRQCIGKDLSRITMPVVFNEPLSFLQRMTEFLEYAWLLDKADAAEDALTRLQYVTAFAVSGLASNWERLGKPFNPLLGETFEFQRDNYRIVCEQVSHHPPISAFHADSANWTFHGSIHPKIKLQGKNVEIQPKGTLSVQLLNRGEAYTWSNVNCCVHNIIVGKLWIEQYGTMEILSHCTGLKSVLTFKSASRDSKELNRIEGFIEDESKAKVSYLFGKWNEFLCVADMNSYSEYVKNNPIKFSRLKKAGRMRGNSTAGIPEDFGNSGKDSNRSSRNVFSKFNSFASSLKTSLDLESAVDCYEIPPSEQTNTISPESESANSLDVPDALKLWESSPRPENSPKYYQFTSFAMSLNETDAELESEIAPTDSRLRPDIRFLEDGKTNEASSEKVRLEEKQRAVRKSRKKEKLEEPECRWFSQGRNPFTMQDDWLYSGQYWDRKYKDIVDIF